MASRHVAAEGLASAQHRRTVRHYRGLRAAALALLAAGLAVGTVAAYLLIELETSLVSYDTDALLTNRPSVRAPTVEATDSRDPFAGRAVNILVMGSDSRDGENQAIGGGNSGSMRSDTTLVVHVSADRRRVEAVSIPRDTLVDIPPCTLSNGVTTGAAHTKFNAAFSFGATMGENTGDAAACTIQTVESITGIRIDGFVVVDFAGFVGMVDALGYVEVCVERDMASTDARLDVKAGCQDFDGTTALAYARARKGKGMPEGSDIKRIGRQQQLLSAMLDRVREMNLFTSFPDIYRFATATARSVTTSDNLDDARDLAGFALSLGDLSPNRVDFITAPHVDAGDRANVLFAADAWDVWGAIAEDRPPTLPTSSLSPGTRSGETSSAKSDPGSGIGVPGTPVEISTPSLGGG